MQFMAGSADARGWTRRLSQLRDISLQWKLGLLFVGGLLLLFGLFAFLGEVLTADTSSSMAAERLSVARLTASFLDREFEQQFMQLEWAASQVGPEPLESSEAPRAWADLTLSSAPMVSHVFLIDRSGHLVWSNPAGRLPDGSDLSIRTFVREPLTTGQRYVSPVFNDPSTQQPTVAFAVPVRTASGEIRGVLATSLTLSRSMDRLLLSASSEIGPGGHAELVDQNLNLIASSESDHVLRAAEHPTFYRPLLEQHLSSVGLTDPIGDEDPGDGGQRHIMAFVPLRRLPWGLGVGASEATFSAMSARWRGYTLALGGLALAIGAYLVWLTRRRVVAPLKNLACTSQRIAAGDLATPVRLEGDGEVRLLARALEDMRGQLHKAHLAEAELSRLKDDFLTIASHELRTPVAALSALTQLQRSRIARGLEPASSDWLTSVHEQLERLSRLIGHLLDSSRLETGQLTLDRRPSDLKRVVEDAAHVVALTDASVQNVEVYAPAAVPAMIDPLRVAQVVTNLIENAVKHSPPDMPIRVQLTLPEAGKARLVVRDHGAGIDPAHRAHVFERYFTQPPEGGTSPGLGLGLYVSREIVAMHSGVIAVETPDDGGTAFVVTLPTGVP